MSASILSRAALSRAAARLPTAGQHHRTGRSPGGRGRRNALARARGHRSGQAPALMGVPEGYLPEAIAGGYGPVGGNCNPGCGVRDEQVVRKQRRQALNFPRQSVAAGTQANITVSPQSYFIITALRIPSSVAVNFTIDDFRVGNNSQLLAAGAGSAEIFTEVAIDTDLCLDEAYPGIQLVLTVTNTDAVAQVFTATVLGCALR